MEQLRILFRRISLLNASCCDDCCGEKVSMAQCNILHEMKRHPASSMQNIAEALGVEITTFSRQVKQLESKGFLVKHHAPGDRRMNMLELTSAGVSALSNIDVYIERRLSGIFENMSCFEQEAVARSLTLLNESMATAEPSGE